MNVCCQQTLHALADEVQTFTELGHMEGPYWPRLANHLRWLAGPIVPIHMCPSGDSSWTPCCSKNVHELLGHRMTINPDLVTCKQAKNAD